MNTDEQSVTPSQEAAWGAPPPPPERRRRWSPRRIAVTAAVAVAIAAAGGVAIWVAGSAATDENGMARGGGPQMVVGGPMSELDHGEFQNGEITEITDTSLTARSEDGYERTYTIDDDTQLVGDLDKGDDVMIMATVDGDTATAASVVEKGEMNRRPGDGVGPPPQNRN